MSRGLTRRSETVLVVEYGILDESEEVNRPFQEAFNPLLAKAKYDHKYLPISGLENRVGDVENGAVVGGGSAVNC
jgi:hypothetical protein